MAPEFDLGWANSPPELLMSEALSISSPKNLISTPSAISSRVLVPGRSRCEVQAGQTAGKFGQDHALASHSLQLEQELEFLMNDIYGPPSTDSSQPGDPGLSSGEQVASALVTGQQPSKDEAAEARVVRLRAYGNAINAEQAKIFIEAFLETEERPLGSPSDLIDLEALI